MTEPVLALDYVVTVDDLRAEMARSSRMSLTDWVRWGFAAYLTWMAMQAWQREDYPSTAAFMFFAVYLGFSRNLLKWGVLTWMKRRHGQFNIHVEIDSVSLLNHDSRMKYGYRYWWSRLSGVEVTDRNYALLFDRDSYPTLWIPHKAFADDDQRRFFEELIERHLAKANSPV